MGDSAHPELLDVLEDSSPIERAASRPSSLIERQFVTGSAGTGKTFKFKSRLDAGEDGIVLAASTGIAAVNLGAGVTTIHSLLGFYDEQSLRDKYVSGRITTRLEQLIRAGMRELVLDECSMFTGTGLQIICDALIEAAERVHRNRVNWEPIRFSVVGDALQLPPVDRNAQWFFECESWDRFTIERLTRIWRQSDPQFLEALGAARRGEGLDAAGLLKQSGVEFASALQDGFPGTTIMGRNDQVDRYNLVELQKVKGRQFLVRAQRWMCDGAQEPSEWSKQIPAEWPVKIGALVMVLANQRDGAGGALEVANGDLGWVREWNPDDKTWSVELQRNGQEVRIGKLRRTHEVTQLMPLTQARLDAAEAMGMLIGKDMTFEEKHKARLPYRVGKKWVVGEVEYYPLRLAWATTCHKSQGLSLDAVQLDMRNAFMGEPAMCYVAMSRARTPQGLRIVGTPELLAKRLKVHPKAKGWI